MKAPTAAQVAIVPMVILFGQVRVLHAAATLRHGNVPSDSGVPGRESRPEAALLPVTNIYLLFSGYNVIKAQPFSNTGIDPGIAHPVFAMTFNQGRTTPDGQYAVPDGVIYEPYASCSFTVDGSDFTVMTSGAEFQDAMLSERLNIVERAAGDPIVQASFTSSQMYQSLFASGAGGSMVTIAATADCSIYTAMLDATVPSASLDPAFIANVALLDPSNPATIEAFVQSYGTHYMTQATFGGAAFTNLRLTATNYTMLQNEQFSFSMAAQLLLWNALGMDVSGQFGYAQFQQLLVSSVNMQLGAFATPSMPPTPSPTSPYSGGNWQQAVGLGTSPGPQVIRNVMAPLTEILVPAYFPNDTLILAKQTAVAAYLNYNYCNALTSPPCSYVNPNPVVAYFASLPGEEASCPQGWQQYAPANGRLIIAADGSANYPAGISVGSPLLDLTLPTHNHSITMDFWLDMQGVLLSQMPGVKFLSSGAYAVVGNLLSYSPGLPFFQMLTCVLPAASSSPLNFSFPMGGIAFMDYQSIPTCPAGWDVSSTTAGYHLMPSATTLTVPADQPLNLATAVPIGNHTHAASVALATPPNINVDGSLTDDNQDGPGMNNGDLGVWGDSDPGNLNVPYLSLLACNTPTWLMPGQVAPNMLVFASSCADLNSGGGTWISIPGGPLGAQGRFIVSTPRGGTSFAAFGDGDPLAPGSANVYDNLHAHDLGVWVDDFRCVQFAGARCGPGNPICNGFPRCGAMTVNAGSQDTSKPDSGPAYPPFLQYQLCIQVGDWERLVNRSQQATDARSPGASP